MQDKALATEDKVLVGEKARLRMKNAEQRVEVNLPNMIQVMIKLARILAEEVDCLDTMRIKDMEALQEDKWRYTRILDFMKRYVDEHPAIRDTFLEEDKETFREVAAIFNEVLAENHEKLLVAKEINHLMVEAIAEVVREESQKVGYSARGITGETMRGAPSISLNQTI